MRLISSASLNPEGYFINCSGFNQVIKTPFVFHAPFVSYFFGLKKVTKKACRMYASTRSAAWQAHHGKETPDALMWIAQRNLDFLNQHFFALKCIRIARQPNDKHFSGCAMP